MTRYSYEITAYMRMEAADRKVGSGVQCVLDAVFYFDNCKTDSTKNGEDAVMKVAIWGCRDGIYLYNQIQANPNSNYEVYCFGDNGEKYKNTELMGLSVLDVEQIAEEYHKEKIKAVIVAVRKGYSRFQIINQLKEKEIENIILVKPSPLTFQLPITFDINNTLYHKQWLHLKDVQKPLVHHLELHAADGCNLNCKGCLHFANLHDRKEFPDLEELLRDVSRIAEECEIFQLRVLGGEPLLNPQLPSFLEKLRKILPNSDIAVISNGILIPSMPDDLYHIMKQNYIGFNLTLYKPTLKMKDKIYDVLDTHGVAYGSHEAQTDKFEKFIVLNPKSEKSSAYKKCISRGILTVKEGQLFKCPIHAYVGKFLGSFHIPTQKPEGISIYENGMDWKGVIDNLYTEQGEFCKHCSEETVLYEWGNGAPVLEDWIVL